MQKNDPLIRTKLRQPFVRSELVTRRRLQGQILQGLRRPLTLVTAPAGFGKTTLVASCIATCGMPVAWLSLDKNDNQTERFLSYFIAALKEVDPSIASEAEQMLSAVPPLAPETILTSLINDLDSDGKELVLVLDDYHFISSQAVQSAVAFLLEHCPRTFHLVIVSRSDPSLPLVRLRARGLTVELRAADLRFTEPESTQFLNDVMHLNLDPGSVSALSERTEGWVAGLQMAALSMRNREDIHVFIEGFSGTNRYILDYLLEEVLASQPSEIRRFLLFTSILERLTAPLCDTVLAKEEGVANDSADRSPDLPLHFGQSAAILEYLERTNLFLVSLDDERTWYRYHHLFADLLRAQLQKTIGEAGVNQLHIRASEWHAKNGSILEAIHHASVASDEARVEKFIEKNYMEMVSRGEQSWIRYWTGKLDKELVYRRPWLCIYEAYSHSWFGELDEAEQLIAVAEKHLQSSISDPEAHSMQGLLNYVKSRVAAMRGDIDKAIKLCLAAREAVPSNNLALRLDTAITLGYEYFLNGDYANAIPILQETVRSGITAGAVINTVAAYCLLARLYSVQGLLNQSYETYLAAARSIPEASGQHLGSRALVEIGIAELLCERNDLEGALLHINDGLSMLPLWDKADDSALAYLILARIHLAMSNKISASEAVEKAAQLIQTRGGFVEARTAVEIAQVRLWLAQGDLQAAIRWAASLEERLNSEDRFKFNNELLHINRARVLIAQNKPVDAINLLSHLEEIALSTGRIGRLIEILLLEALASQETGASEHALLLLTKCLTLAEPEDYRRVFLDEGQPMQRLLVNWLAHDSSTPLRDYTIRLLSQFDAEPSATVVGREKASPAGDSTESPGQALVEPLSERELEILCLIALGLTNHEIARQLFIASGTVKAHTSNIYRKLDVANRMEAVGRARQLGLI